MTWQTARPTRGNWWDKVEGWNAGYPEKLLANDKILVSNGSYTPMSMASTIKPTP